MAEEKYIIPGIESKQMETVAGMYAFKQKATMFVRNNGLHIDGTYGFLEILYGLQKMHEIHNAMVLPVGVAVVPYESHNLGVLGAGASVLQKETAKLWNSISVALLLAFKKAAYDGQFRELQRADLDNALVGTVADFWRILDAKLAQHPGHLAYLREKATKTFDATADTLPVYLSQRSMALIYRLIRLFRAQITPTHPERFLSSLHDSLHRITQTLDCRPACGTSIEFVSSTALQN